MQYLTRQKIPMHVVIKTINVVSLLYLNFHFRLKSEDDNSDSRNILLEGVYIFCSLRKFDKLT